MAALGLNAKTTSEKAGLGSTAVHDIVTGKNARPALSVIRAIAKALDTTVGFLSGDNSERPEILGVVKDIPLVGYAETGAFRPMVDFGDDFVGDLPVICAEGSRAHPTAKLFALTARGDSMNASRPPIIEGMTVLCVDFVDAGIEIETGRVYAVRRTRDSGQTWELTVKRAHVFRDRYELRPESTNPAHTPIIIPRGNGGASLQQDDGTVIEVIGLVYGTFQSFE